MKIAFVVHDYSRSYGHGRYVVELATRFCRDHDVHVFANTVESEPNQPITFHHVPAWRVNALATVLSFPVPAALQIRGAFDIVHTQGFCTWGSSIITAHQCNREWHRARRSMGSIVPWRETVFGWVTGALEHALYGTCTSARVIAISRGIAGHLRQHYGCTAPMSVVYHGVDLKRFHPDNRAKWRVKVRLECGLAGDEPCFLFVGDMRKGAAQCLRALALLPAGKLLFVSRSDADSYRKIANTLGIDQRVVFAGPRENVESFYAAADALVLPTPHDSFAMVVTEAMSAGIPAIVSQFAGASEMVRHGENGLILEDPRNHNDLARHMRLFLEDPSGAQALGDQARRTVERWSWDDVASKTLEVYKDYLLSRPSLMRTRPKHAS